MTEESPVFRTKFEVDVWAALDRADKQAVPEKRDKILSNVLREILTRPGTLSSPLLCRIIRTLASVGASGWEKDVEDLVAKQRPEDCHPALTAASVMATKGILSLANTYLESVTVTTDVAFYARVRAEVLAACGKTKEAISSLWLSLRSNPLDTSAYLLLQRLDPTVNWMAYCAIDRMVAGMPYDRPAPDPAGSELVLYGIYDEWFHGDRETATRLLIASEGYRTGNADFILLSARMARDKGDIDTARNMYVKATDSLPDDIGVLCEAASVFLEGDNPDAQTAHVRYREAEARDPGNFNVIRGLIRTYRAMGRDAEAADVLRDFLATEAAEKSDYVYGARLFMDIGFPEDAAEITEALAVSFPTDSEVFVLRSRVAVNEGDLGLAADYAKKAVRFGKNNAEALAQQSRVSLLLRQTSVAVRQAKKAVACDTRSVPALSALMDAYRETGDVDNTVKTCRLVLDVEPDNAHARDILSCLEMERVVRGDGSTSDLPSADSAEEFIYLLKGLIEENRYSEVLRLCNENYEAYGNLAEVRRLKGNAEYATREYVKASASFASAAVLMPDSAEIWHSKGLADEGFGDLDSALEAYDRAVLLDMREPRYWISRGCVLEAKGDDIGAVEAFNRAIELDQTAPYPLVRKAAILASYGRYSEALVFMDMAGNADRDNVGIRRIRMKMCLAAGRYTEAAALCRNILASEDDPAIVAGLIRAEMSLGDMGSALNRLNSALSGDSRNLDILHVARDLYLKVSDVEHLVDVCHVILSVDPMDRETRLILADALMRNGRSDEANQLYAQVDSAPAPVVESSSPENPDDPIALLSIARSMLQMGALDGAGRNADKLLKIDPDNEDYIIFRAQVYKECGDVRIAESFMNDYLRREPDSIRILEALGDLKAGQKLYQDAAELYSRCLSVVRSSGNSGYRARLLVKLAEVQEGMKARPAAIRSYTEAVNLDPLDTVSARALTRLLLVSGDRDTALNVIHSSLNVEESAASFAVLIQVCQSFGDVEGVRDAYRGFIRFESPSEEDVLTVVAALSSVGLVSEAEMLRGHSDFSRRSKADVSVDVPPSVKRCAERLMRRAYMQGISIDDPSIRDTMDIDSELAIKALAYLADLPSYGDVIPGTSDYERMETLSFNIMAAPRSRGIENVNVATAYVAGHAKDADEAKILVSYIQSAKTSKLPSSIPQEIRKVAISYNKGATIEQIMLDNHCGVMTARIIQSCI